MEGRGRCKAEEQAADANEFWLELGLTGVQEEEELDVRRRLQQLGAVGESDGRERTSWREACVRYLGACCEALLLSGSLTVIG